MKKLRNILPYVIAIAMLLAMIINIFLTFSVISKQQSEIESVKSNIKILEETIQTISKPLDGVNGLNGYTPVKGKDYFDGKNGKDSISTHTIETLVREIPVNGKDGVDGLTPELRCNTVKNRWEVRYSQDDLYQVLGDEPVKCTIGYNEN